MIKIFKTLFWLALYLLFNAVLFFIEISVLFKRGNQNYSGNSGLDSIDDILEAFNEIFNVLEGIVMVFYLYYAIGLAIVAFILFIPIQVYYINRKFKNHKKKFLYSLLASFAVVMTLKLLLYAWMFIDLNYL